MKKITFIAIIASLTSCSTSYFQIYKTQPVNASTGVAGNVYENAECRITYDFWAEGGDAGFTVFNKTSEPLTINMDRSFYIVNGKAYDYYQARTFTTSQTESKTVYATGYFYRVNLSQAAASSSGHSTSFEERPEITIPPKSSKSFSEYIINPFYFNHCNLAKYPTRRKIKRLNFSVSDSPFVFSNNITYTVGGKTNTLSHEFYVSELTNLPQSEEIKDVREQNCDSKRTVRKHVNASPENFFIRYSKK
ncbi:MAG: hypothetical protein EOO50_02660 [Flavobacterium sp.]|uniref:hypothetical protein n=1 Tax=Flavobacterium sp. TaxID=239 RepID=UPI00121A6429|nr:hypothetical protein [Flavobacterium sp.]RZJ68340.1 MAG: hypothetical protein EOO50_02660 [Flavobacterium sp.]